MTYIQISPLVDDTYQAWDVSDCHNDNEREAYRIAMNRGCCIVNHILAVRMSA